jgi:hypothetical protein
MPVPSLFLGSCTTPQGGLMPAQRDKLSAPPQAEDDTSVVVEAFWKSPIVYRIFPGLARDLRKIFTKLSKYSLKILDFSFEIPENVWYN